MDIVIPASVTQSLGMAEASPAPVIAPTETPQADKPAPDVPPPKNATAAEKKIWKIKADGEEFDFDASDEQAIKNEIAKARGANKRFQEAAEIRKAAAAEKAQAEKFYEMLKSDPMAVLSDPRIGHDVKKLAEEYIWAQMQEEKLSPDQKHQRDLAAELKKYRDAELTQKQQAEAAQKAQLESHYEAQYETTIIQALQLGGVPNTKGAVRRMGFYMQQALANDIDLQPADLVAQVRRDLQEEHREMYATADSDSLISLLGEDLAKKLRAADVKRLKSTQPEQHRKPAPSERAAKRDQAPKKLQAEDWKADLERRLLGKA